jgi:UDP-N-acetylglucosamine--N-acetylmuramyl-(pentapeptide) pyrophosphoryl-undecaprenol N-acetylglucosamine transferase
MVMKDSRLNILIAGGGTGGHLFPGIAIARTFLARNPESRILFVGTDRPFEKRVLAGEGFEHRSVTAAGIKGLGILSKAAALFKVPVALIQSMGYILSFNPQIIIGVGGYSSGPVALAGWLMRRPIILHEQNILPGITNRLVGRFARRIHVSFEESMAFFPAKKVFFTGNPVRQSILSVERNAPSEGRFTVFVSGGSQGAHRVNTAVVEALDHLENKASYHFIHQTGDADCDMVTDAYASRGISAKVQPFYTDMDAQYSAADIIIGRAGATSMAEITAIGLPAILIPYPYAADNHQVKNALSLSSRGAAEMITEDVLDGKTLADRLAFYRNNPEALKKISEQSKEYGKPRAAEDIADDCYDLLFIDG